MSPGQISTPQIPPPLIMPILLALVSLMLSAAMCDQTLLLTQLKISKLFGGLLVSSFSLVFLELYPLKLVPPNHEYCWSGQRSSVFAALYFQINFFFWFFFFILEIINLSNLLKLRIFWIFGVFWGVGVVVIEDLPQYFFLFESQEKCSTLFQSRVVYQKTSLVAWGHLVA